MSSSDPRFLSGSVFFFIKARIVFFYSCLSLDQGRYCVSLAHSHSSISGQVWAVGGRWCDEPENERTSQIDHRCYYVSLTNNFQDSPSHIQGPQWSLSFLSQCTNFSSLVHSDRLRSLCFPFPPLIKLSVTEHSLFVPHNCGTHSRKPSGHQIMLIYSKSG